MVHRKPTVFSIAPGIPFLPAIADALASGKLVEDFSFNGDPLALTDATIYVPTRRAARELRSAFLDRLGGETVLLPLIRPLGEFDDDADLFSGAVTDAMELPPAIDSLERQVLLGKLISGWSKGLPEKLLQLYGEEAIETPVSTADAYWMAADLAALIDQMHTEGSDFNAVAEAAEADVSQWWSLTLEFLSIIRDNWPAILKERNRLDPAAHRDQMIRAEAVRLTERPPSNPIIVAGSTGSVPATAELIAAVARLPRGAVVLPGYDIRMDNQTRAILERTSPEPGIVSHPQFSLHTLIRKMNVDPAQIDLLGSEHRTLADRRQWVSEALRPSETTGTWVRTHKSLPAGAFDNVMIINAENERAEAASIAAALRETVNSPGKTAALVTTDRTLARRVVGELQAYGIAADDSGGTPFNLTIHGRLLNVLLQVAFSLGGPSDLLALLKHPLVRIGVDDPSHRRAVSLFEQMVLRGSKGRFDAASITTFVERNLTAIGDLTRQPDWMKRLQPDDFEAVRAFALRLEAALAPLVHIRDQREDCTVVSAVTATIRSMELLATDEHQRFEKLYTGNSGVHLAKLLRRLLTVDADVRFDPSEWPHILPALAGQELVKPEAGGHPRVFIWGALEARLQTVDRMVLGGLNEGTWPSQTSNDAFLTRAQKDKIGLLPPERRIGLSAHDFQMAMGQPEIILSRSLRSEGAPAVPSRWWQRLMTLAGSDVAATLTSRGDRYVALSGKAFAKPLEKSAPRPFPKPNISARPDRFSVTEINTLKSDPYAIYARKILGLKKIDPLIRDPDASDRGTLIHGILEEAVRAGVDFTADDAARRLHDIGEALFDDERLPAEIRAMWWPRFSLAIDAYIDWERKRDDAIETRFAEVKSYPVDIDGTGVSLTGRADRIDRRRDGLVDIVDYKTGTVPTKANVRKLIAAQMPLEAALVKRCGFKEVGARDTDQLTYLSFGARGEVDPASVANIDAGDNGELVDLGDKAWHQLVKLVKHYANEQTGYLSHAAVPSNQRFASDYDHLARVLEWSAGNDADGGEA